MEDTLKLIEKAQKGDTEAYEKIVKDNTGLIWSVVKKFSNRGHDLEDLFQIGSIGLLKCINKFKLHFNVKFSTYAVPMIMGEIKRFLRDDGLIKVSRPLKEIAIKAKYLQDDIIKKTGKTPTITELAKAAGIDTEELVEALEAGSEVESLYATIYEGEGNPIYLIDKLDNIQSSYEKMIDSISLRQLISSLDPKEQHIIILRYFDDKTQSEVAREMGVSQVQVSRIEKKVLLSMRSSLKSTIT